MSVYVDPLMPCQPNKRWRWNQVSHLIADSLEELHEFAARLGLKREWFQNHRLAPHYDLTPGKRNLAIQYGVVELTHRESVAKRLEIREAG